MSKSRNWIFTLNNYTDDDVARLRTLDARYLIFGREIAPTTGTPHLQGYVTWTNPRALGGVRRLLPGCHVERARGLPSQCSDYCKKDGDYEEFGERPADPGAQGDREKDRWDDALEKAKKGEIDEIPSDIVLRYYNTLRKIGTDFEETPSVLANTTGIWIFGLSGAGKTRSVFDTYPGAYLKGINKWWCSYKNEPVVLLDDIDPSHSTWIGTFLKRWGDRYPFIGESKGGSRKIRPTKFIVTSQYKIEDIFPDQETRSALNRRFIVIEKKFDQNIIL